MEGQQRDGALVVRIAGGDQAALGALYDAYAGLMLGVAARILRDEREAEDLIHDVFVEVWQKAGTYRPKRGSVRTWLLVRLRSRALDRKRSARSRHTVLVDSHPQAQETSPTGDPALEADRQRVRSALVDLSDEQRAVVLTAYFEGLSSTEIAQRLSIPVGTVKSRLRTARDQLRQNLSPARSPA